MISCGDLQGKSPYPSKVWRLPSLPNHMYFVGSLRQGFRGCAPENMVGVSRPSGILMDIRMRCLPGQIDALPPRLLTPPAHHLHSVPVFLRQLPESFFNVLIIQAWIGVFGDREHNYVGFRGSMNETFQGLSPAGNIESVDVFPSWVDERDRIRVNEAQTQFENLWNGIIPNVRVMAFPEAASAIVREKARNANWEKLIDEVRISESIADKWCADIRPGNKRPRPHQYKALEAWEKNDYKGIFEHATGSGKTYTAMCAIRHELDRGKSVLVLVPSIDLLNQWFDEMQENIYVPGLNYLLCGGGHNEWKKNGMLARWTQRHPDEKTVVLATMDTACSSIFLNMVSGGNHLFIVADEVHRLGSSHRQRVFSIEAGSRLALSATPRRYGDASGTAAIFAYFGGIIPPPFSLADAINAQVLTRYFYHPHTVKLTLAEQEEWDTLTKDISKLVARAAAKDAECIFNSPTIKKKLLARARILKNAAAKVHIALTIIAAHYQTGQKWIVYCDNQTQLQEVLALLLRNGYDAYEYHSEMKGDREQTLEYFASCGGILVSMSLVKDMVFVEAHKPLRKLVWNLVSPASVCVKLKQKRYAN